MESSQPFFSAPPFPPAPGQRSLAAIVFTDVVGFSARVQADEETTLRLLKRDFETMREMGLEHRGSVLKSTGDGLLLYFPSAVQAVACALAMQRAFGALLKKGPATECLTHRIGIHLGDVFVNEQDVMGDGVNIAARLQAEAEPGGICISQTVYDVVRNKLALQVTRLGPRELKNISQAIPIYKLVLEAQGLEATPATPSRSRRQVPEQPTTRQKTLLAAALTGLVVIAVVLGVGLWQRQQHLRVRHEAARSAFLELLPTDAMLAALNPALAAWRTELRGERSRALESYDLPALARRAQETERNGATARSEAVLHMQALFGWLERSLQKHDRDHPLKVRELTGTAPKEFRVFVGADRRLYYAGNGVVRQRDWNDLPPAALASIVCRALLEAQPLPPRDVVLGAYAFASLYGLPEIPGTLREANVPPSKS